MIRKISIEGFKSFDKKVCIRFKKGMTCLIGENGCGKSTFFESIVLALGEKKNSIRGCNISDFLSKIYNKNGENEKVLIFPFIYILFSVLLKLKSRKMAKYA